MHEIKMFDRSGALNLEGFSASGADWLERHKRYIDDGKTVVCSPHEICGPNNDVILQLRKRGANKIMLGGMSANLRVEFHTRELFERGFEVAAAKDANAGAWHPESGDVYQAVLISYGYTAKAVLTTDEAVKAMEG